MLKVGLIGPGGVARRHIAAWLKMDDAKVIGVSDVFADRAQAAAEELGAERWTTDFTELLRWDEIDAVDICTTERTHGDIASAAAEHGKHILVEKPIATTLEDADRIIEAAASNGVKLMVAHTHRFGDYALAAKGAIDEGEIGTPVYLRFCSGGGFWKQDWTGKRISPYDTGGNVVTNGVHITDLCNWWMGARPVSVYGQALNQTSSHLNMDDYFMITVKYDNGSIAVVEMSRANMPRNNNFRSIMIIGTEGELKTGTEETEQWLYSDAGLNFFSAGAPGFEREIREFAAYVEGDGPSPMTGEDGRLALEMCLAAERSIRTGEAVPLGG